jgi:hypothetical protein
VDRGLEHLHPTIGDRGAQHRLELAESGLGFGEPAEIVLIEIEAEDARSVAAPLRVAVRTASYRGTRPGGG